MNVESSYEGAVHRLRRLGYAGVELAPPPRAPERDDDGERMRDLEELATLACDDNERLTQELGSARGEIERLQALVSTLRELVADAQADAPLTVPRRGAGLWYLFAIAGGAALLLLLLRPWDLRQLPSAAAAAVPPVVVAAPPPPVPQVEPTIAKVAPTIPTVAPTIPKVAAAAPAPARTRPQRRHPAPHAAAKIARQDKKRAATRSTNKLQSRSNDPLAGLSL